ncbi:uncharacterized protein MELLADRAFT_94567 [Melampsora larici-populina 98AG31]|uniref:Uncharacterized protein n=1 Tax=Melampsora larici-populina (strain 98AG31 / pathotype 3-4-7) TaxID=747676 RepID=F4RBW4_MELLP|nr:uncharacterized protein MELLADRAFT_94567 [Melampsora larici-populina 98AG31]EGG10270.1 hypothetical protein MELLADRAFT_94567 [Melampsora larici-populina 98AG31]
MSTNRQRPPTRITRNNPEPSSQPQTARKRQRRVQVDSSNEQVSATATTNPNDNTFSGRDDTTPQSAPNDYDLDLPDITLQNYHKVQKHWPLERIQEQLKKQTSSNHQISAAVLAEGQAVLGAFEQSLHMIAMVSGVNIDVLKRSLGLLGGTHADNSWHRWLSFAIAANKIAMPARGDPAASDILTMRNQANSKTYRALKKDEVAVFTAEVFYALGGYPDYSAISISDDADVFGDSSALVPEVPKLSPADENRYRPLYEKLVDQDKVARDRELHTPGSSACKEEKRSLQSFKKIALQLARDHQLFGMDYYIIACSNNNTGEGWCREYTSRDEISQWVKTKAQMQHVFPLYCQHESTIEEIKANAAANSTSAKSKRPKNQSDMDKAELVGLLNQLLIDVLGDPDKVFPKIPNPLQALKDRKIPVTIERAPDSTMTLEEFEKGFSGMDTKARRHWISDIKTCKFTVKKEESPPSASVATNQSAESNPTTRESETQALATQSQEAPPTGTQVVTDAGQCNSGNGCDVA